MAHFKIKVADLLIDVVAKGELSARICEPYLVDSAFTDISIYATPAQIKKKMASMPIPLTEEQAECICLHENLALKLVYHDAFVLHASLISYKGKGYAIVAPRGVGKTVHTNMWKAKFGDDVTIINGDKIFLTKESDKNVLLSTRNLPNAMLSHAGSLSTYDILRFEKLILTQDAVKTIEEVFA